MASRVGRLLLSRIASNASASTAPTADRIFQVAGSRLSGVQQSQSMLGSFAAMRSALAAEPRALWAATRSFRTSPTFSASEAAATQPAAPASVETVLKSRELVPSDQGNEVGKLSPANPTSAARKLAFAFLPLSLACLSASPMLVPPSDDGALHVSPILAGRPGGERLHA